MTFGARVVKQKKHYAKKLSKDGVEKSCKEQNVLHHQH